MSNAETNKDKEQKAMLETEQQSRTTIDNVSTTSNNVADETTPPEIQEKEEEKATQLSEKENKSRPIASPLQDISSMDKETLCAKLKETIESDSQEIRTEVENLKNAYYKLQNSRIAQQKNKFITEGGEETDFIPTTDETDEEIKLLLQKFKEKREADRLRKENEIKENLSKKEKIIEQMKLLSENNEDVSAHIPAFKKLQQEWKEIGQVPVTALKDLRQQYNQNQEKFWDLIKINNELRDYDFKKNIEAKTKICEQTEKLAEETDIKIAFNTLQQYHDQWHELGPVAREYREEIWLRFKTASTTINKKHQQFYEEIRKQEEKNLLAKEDICQQMESIEIEKLQSYKAWDTASQKVLKLQEEWRTFGFAPRKHNKQIYARYREICDKFFDAKKKFYKTIRDELNKNLELKKALYQQAEALKESTDWKETAQKMIEIQKEWKKIGAVPRKYSNELWTKFTTVCDYFFEQKNKNTSSRYQEELANLEKKQKIIEKIKAFGKSEDTGETLDNLKALAAEWNAVGHVPFKEKDALHKKYKDALDTQFDKLNIDAKERKMENFKSTIKSYSDNDNKLYGERQKLNRKLEHLKSEIATYENNMGFFRISSKKGGGMLKELERKIEGLKEETITLTEKIKLIDKNMDENG